MGVLRWVKDFLFGDITATANITDEEIQSITTEINIRELAFWSSVNMIANAVSKCEFKTYQENKEVKGKEYYLWNVEPNKNQGSSVFMHKLISRLYRNNECLVISENGQLLVADSFNQKEFALKDNLFTDVVVGDFNFSKVFNMTEVLYFKLSEKDMRKVTNALYDSYGKLIAYGMKSYNKSRGNRGVLSYGTITQGDEKAKAAFDDLMNNRFKRFFNAENAVLPLPKGYEYDEIATKTYSNEGTRDIRAMVDDVSDFTAKALGIHPALFRGDIQGTKDALSHTLTFCIDPLTDMMAEEINRKRNGRKAFMEGTYLEIDTSRIMHIDILSASTAIDKLIGSGAFCINDIRKLVGQPEIDEDFARKHFITKNYADIEEFIKSLERGE